MTNLIKCILALSGLMTSFASVQLPSSTNGFQSSPFNFYYHATPPTLNSPTSEHDMAYHDYPTSTLLGRHIVILTISLRDWRDTQRQLNEALAGIETLKNELNVVKQDAQSSKSKIEELTMSTAASSIGRMPGSCGDLQQIGHKKSGLFSIMESNKIVNVYCDFTKPSNDPALQKWIGYTDVKSLPTYFYAQKRSDFSTLGVPIPFELETLNVGGAMDTNTGKFKAPRKGVYFFAFSGVGVIAPGRGFLDVGLMVNGVHFGRANCDSNTGQEWETLSFQSTIQLKAGDSVWLQIVGQESPTNILTDRGTDGQFTHFSGWLLQEELSL
ncbi:uncharacterized protein LOC124316109 [Daphnia pulicaria]|uniref:uncharacterized protein LOC124316109 n=1 Tax=Daphnia pulicaria TaxID=35523 RepID=UPI001EEA9F86|nr:uncharacterized protein LOC124316109 [Daphnia pulicaria]